LTCRPLQQSPKTDEDLEGPRKLRQPIPTAGAAITVWFARSQVSPTELFGTQNHAPPLGSGTCPMLVGGIVKLIVWLGTDVVASSLEEKVDPVVDRASRLICRRLVAACRPAAAKPIPPEMAAVAMSVTSIIA
jgi:hypothetical protein